MIYDFVLGALIGPFLGLGFIYMKGRFDRLVGLEEQNENLQDVEGKISARGPTLPVAIPALSREEDCP